MIISSAQGTLTMGELLFLQVLRLPDPDTLGVIASDVVPGTAANYRSWSPQQGY